MELNDWISGATFDDGPAFRRVDRHGNPLDSRLSGDAVSMVVKSRVAAVGLQLWS